MKRRLPPRPMAGRLLRIDLATDALACVASNLGAMRAVAVTPDGSVAALAVDDGRLFTIDPATDCETPIARGLPAGYMTTPYPRSGGLALDSAGSFYVAADKENSIYRIRKRSSDTRSAPPLNR